MRVNNNALSYFKQGLVCFTDFRLKFIRWHHNIPFIQLFQKTTGNSVSDDHFHKIKKLHPNIETLSHDRLQCTLEVLKKFDITAMDACQNIHIFTMNPITMDNYGEILRECGFVKILPKHIIKYHTIVRSRMIINLKKEGILKNDLNLEEVLQNYFKEWPDDFKSKQNFPDASTSILTVRMSVLEKYLIWRLRVTSDDFKKYCRNYLPLKHKPMADIQEALNLACNVIKFEDIVIRKNGFIISADPINTKLILQNVDSVAGLDIREGIRIEPAILKNNYNAILQIKNILKEHEISEEAQRKCLRVYCMCPATVLERLKELKNLKEYQVLKTNPRVLSMVVHKKKVMDRLEKIYATKKQCYSLNHLVSSSNVFNTYISSFGSKVCGRDLAVLINSLLQVNNIQNEGKPSETVVINGILKKLKRHKFWLHSALNVINENILFLKTSFEDTVIFNNCQLLLYPVTELKLHINYLVRMRKGEKKLNTAQNIRLDGNYNNLNYSALNDDQILSLVLYEIEKKYHFSGDGIWSRPDGGAVESMAS